MFEGDYLLYSNCIIVLDGLNKLSKFWLQKKRIPYISKQLLVLQELKSLPATIKYIGGEDYRKAMQLYKKNKNIN